MKHKLIFILFLSFLISFSACEKEKNKNNDLKNDFKDAALMHNKAMNEVLFELQKNRHDSINKLVAKTTKNFINNNSYFFLKQLNSKKLLNNEIIRVQSFRMKNTKSYYSNSKDNYLKTTINKYKNSLSIDQKRLLIKIAGIFDQYSDHKNIIKELKKVKDIDTKQLSSEERHIIYAATTIGIESCKYWHKNIDRWALAIYGDNLKTHKKDSSWFDWGSVGESDIAGAVGGAIGGATVGAVAGGAGAGPSAIIGGVSGGIGSSAQDAVNQLLAQKDETEN